MSLQRAKLGLIISYKAEQSKQKHSDDISGYYSFLCIIGARQIFAAKRENFPGNFLEPHGPPSDTLSVLDVVVRLAIFLLLLLLLRDPQCDICY